MRFSVRAGKRAVKWVGIGSTSKPYKILLYGLMDHVPALKNLELALVIEVV